MQRHLVARYVSYTRVAHCALRVAQLLEIFQAVLQLLTHALVPLVL